jgi:hypothetical protein
MYLEMYRMYHHPCDVLIPSNNVAIVLQDPDLSGSSSDGSHASIASGVCKLCIGLRSSPDEFLRQYGVHAVDLQTASVS